MDSTPVRPLSALVVLVLLLVPFALPDAKARQLPPSQMTYRISALPELPGRPFFRSFASAINEQGQIVGTVFFAETESVAVLWENGVATELPSLGGPKSFAQAIAEDGSIVGNSELPVNAGGDPIVHAVLWKDRTSTDLGTLPGCSSRASSINSKGDIVGGTYESGSCAAGLLWRDGAIVNLGAVEPRVFTPSDITDSGIIVGAVGIHSGDPTAAIWQDGKLTLLPEPIDSISQAVGMNAAETVVGFYVSRTPQFVRAVTWADGVMIEQPLPDGFRDGYARGINDFGQIIGDVHAPTQTNDQQNKRCVLWWNGESIDLTASLVNGAGWVIESVTDINDRGQIVGIGRFNNEQRAILLTPETS